MDDQQSQGDITEGAAGLSRRTFMAAATAAGVALGLPQLGESAAAATFAPPKRSQKYY